MSTAGSGVAWLLWYRRSRFVFIRRVTACPFTVFVFTTYLRAAPRFTLALLRAVRRRQPGSVYALAKMVGRDLKNVQQDLKILEQHGLIKLGSGRGKGKRAVTVPTALFREIALRIAI